MSNRPKSSLLRAFFLIFWLGWVGFSAGPSNLPLPPPAEVDSINESDLRQHEEFLASDELGGRYSFSPSNAIAARYLASRLHSYGFRGGAEDGSFLQKVELVNQQFNPDESFVELNQKGGQVRYHFGKDFRLEVPMGEADVQGELVFVPSHLGATATGNQSDLKGKIAIVPVDGSTAGSAASDKSGASFTSDRSRRRVARDIIQAIGERGAVGVLLLYKERAETPHASEATSGQSGEGGRLVFPDEVSTQPTFPVARVYEPSVIQGLFEGTPVDSKTIFSTSSPESLQPLGKHARIKTSMQGPKKVTHNVIGILDGADPQLKTEYVMFSAHLDHLESTPTEIYNGADDDGSGTSAVLEIAQAFTIGPRPRRSILIVFHSGEEEGLWGSKYFVQHPTVPLTSIVVDLNVDMIGRTRTPDDTNPADAELSDANTVYLIGSDKLSQELHTLSEQTNQDTVKMVFDYRYNREDHPYRLYYRSDHWNYAKNGIPVIFYFTGLHQDYHRPTDDVEKLDFTKMARITKLIFTTGWRIANLDHRLKVDGPTQ
jgi:hypothetical protein